MQKISVQWADIALDDIDARFAAIAASGIEAVDFDLKSQVSYKEMAEGAGSKFYNRSMDQLKKHFRPYLESARKNGISFGQAHAPCPPNPHGKPVPDVNLQIIIKCIELCAFLECPFLVVHPLILAYYTDKDYENEENIRFYSSLIPYAKKFHVRICLENMYRGNNARVSEAACSDPHQAVYLIDTLNKIAGEEIFCFCFDVGHANLLKKDIYQFLSVLGHRVKALHIHENDGTYDMHLLPYTQGVDWTKCNSLDWDSFLKGLRKIKYSGNINFEIHHVWNLMPKEVHPQMLCLVKAIGVYFKNQIKE